MKSHDWLTPTSCHLSLLVLMGILFQGTTDRAVAKDPFEKDLLEPAQLAAKGFMLACPNPVEGHPELRRAAFMCAGLPVPVVAHDQWDWGDCTARAVRNWIWYREMTGDTETGREMEAAQKAALLYVLTPDKGMACVPDRSKADEGIYHYQMWDQGRTLRALVLWWQTATDPGTKADLKRRIDKMIASLSDYAVRGEDPTYGPYAVYPFDFIEGDERGHDLYCIRGGQLIEPLAVYYHETQRDDVRQFIEELYAGLRSGKEGAPYNEHHQQLFIFGENGSFDGHFHAHVSAVLGVARYAHALHERGETDRALELVRWARVVYDWTLSPENVNAGSSWGWFPENMEVGNDQSREVSETCCVADMIEFAAVLAEASGWDASLADYDALWDHVERYTVNYIMNTQFFITPAYLQQLRQVQNQNPVLRNGYLEFELDAGGNFNHEMVSRPTLRREHQTSGGISQTTYAIEYAEHSATFSYEPNRPIQPDGFEVIEATRVDGGRLIGKVRTEDQLLDITSTITAGAGPYFIRRFEIANVSDRDIDSATFWLAANFDSVTWSQDSAELIPGSSSVMVTSAAGDMFLGISSKPVPSHVMAEDAETILKAAPPFERVAPGSNKFTGNVAVRYGWELDTLEPGGSKTIDVTLAVTTHREDLQRALRGETFPDRAPSDTGIEHLDIAQRLEGSWISCIQVNEIAALDDAGRPIFYTGGCCAYSGPRGLLGCWQPAIADDGKIVQVRIPIHRDHPVASQEVTESTEEVRQRIRLKQDRRVSIRIPDWADLDAVEITKAGRTIDFEQAGRWLDAGACSRGDDLVVTYPMKRRTVTERVGGAGKSIWFSPPEEKRTFTTTWLGNRVIAIKPKGIRMPVFQSLLLKQRRE